MKNDDKPTLWYFADPMCSWCWGFSPVITEIKKNFAEKIKIAFVMGRLQPNETQVLSEASRNEIFDHWHLVSEMTHQKFSFIDALPEGFIYNTEPACRAVITVASIDLAKTFSYFSALQSAFYTKNLDVTQLTYLQQIAGECGIDANTFKSKFNEKAQTETVIKNFQFTHKAGVKGFPTLILVNKEQLEVVSRGYDNYENISANLDTLDRKSVV